MLRHRSGQTLLEGIIAISVVAIGIMGVVGLAISNQVSAQSIGDRAVATALAREGLEAAKHIRDSNWLAGRSFSVGLLDGATMYAVPDADIGSTGIAVALAFGDYSDFSGDDTRVTWLVEVGRYGQLREDGGTPTKFRRRLELVALCSSDGSITLGLNQGLVSNGATCSGQDKLVGARVLSHVQWPRGSGTQLVSLELWLFDWR